MKRLTTLLLVMMLITAMIPSIALSEGKTQLYVYYVDKMNEDFLKSFEQVADVEVVPIYVASEDWAQYMTVAIGGGNQIDVMEINGQDVRGYAQKGLLMDLKDEVDYVDRFYDKAFEPLRVDGGLYAIPFNDGTSMAVFYNKQIFADAGLEVPTTWEELENCKNVLNEKGIALLTHCGATTYMWPSWFFTLFAQATDGNAVGRTFETLKGEGSFMDADYIETMGVLERLGKDGYFMDGVNALDRDAAVQAFIDGQCAMYYSGIWDRGAFRAGGMDEDILGIMNMPVLTENGQPDKIYTTGAASGCVLSVYSKTEHKDLALQMIDFYTQAPQTVDFRFQYALVPENVTGSVFPPYVEFTIPEGYEVDPLDPQIRELVGHADVWLDWYWPSPVTEAFKEMIQAVVGKQIDAESAMQYIQDAYDEAVTVDGYVFS
jgi:ABC-type glycerol-3-phosphate transport system substrate-binding protein